MADTKMKLQILQKLHKEQEALYEERNTKYGDSFSKTYQEYGPKVALIRLEDKLNRAKTLVKAGLNTSDGESLRDTLMDLSNYSNMFLIELLRDIEALEKPRKKRKTVTEVPAEGGSQDGPLGDLTKAQLVEVAKKLGATLPRKANREKLYKIINGFNMTDVAMAITSIMGESTEDGGDEEAE